MSSGQGDPGERLQGYCRIIWGEGDYDLSLETDDYLSYFYYVQKDYGTYLGDPIAMTTDRPSVEAAGWELERMLRACVAQVESKQKATKP